jgi:hypothetical protein
LHDNGHFNLPWSLSPIPTPNETKPAEIIWSTEKGKRSPLRIPNKTAHFTIYDFLEHLQEFAKIHLANIVIW